jgi:hypothetical protein
MKKGREDDNETYNIVRNGKSWTVNHDGVLEGDYATKEAAFESAAAAASKAIKDGVGIAITVEPVLLPPTPQSAPKFERKALLSAGHSINLISIVVITRRLG